MQALLLNTEKSQGLQQSSEEYYYCYNWKGGVQQQSERFEENQENDVKGYFD